MPGSIPTVSPLIAGIKCRCPRCGKGKLFASLLGPAEKCSNCGLRYAFVDTGDGPAVFGIFIMGFLCLGGALLAEFKLGVPWWMHILLWGIMAPILTLFLLRFLKATLIALQYRNKAEEGRLTKE